MLDLFVLGQSGGQAFSPSLDDGALTWDRESG
ncbi:hypothetical protein SAMN04488123_101157 [Natribacillus halophilus]|uniref:Uncharacterized protein n=1 Tax=Natribacillus halophilus TaxID=549003 RepID=A0A1G8JC44_9BACI|nr:hypothetical protein SAMN04488123_101157 [Natribacillus halophilus]